MLFLCLKLAVVPFLLQINNHVITLTDKDNDLLFPYILDLVTYYFSFCLVCFIHNLFLKNIFNFIFDCSGSWLLCAGFSLVVASRGYSPIEVHRLLIEVPPLVVGLP